MEVPSNLTAIMSNGNQQTMQTTRPFDKSESEWVNSSLTLKPFLIKQSKMYSQREPQRQGLPLLWLDDSCMLPQPCPCLQGQVQPSQDALVLVAFFRALTHFRLGMHRCFRAQASEFRYHSLKSRSDKWRCWRSSKAHTQRELTFILATILEHMHLELLSFLFCLPHSDCHWPYSDWDSHAAMASQNLLGCLAAPMTLVF